jgi:hypothetical protein
MLMYWRTAGGLNQEIPAARSDATFAPRRMFFSHAGADRQVEQQRRQTKKRLHLLLSFNHWLPDGEVQMEGGPPDRI